MRDTNLQSREARVASAEAMRALCKGVSSAVHMRAGAAKLTANLCPRRVKFEGQATHTRARGRA